MAKPKSASKGEQKVAPKGYRRVAAAIVGQAGPPPTDIAITGTDVGYISVSVFGGATVVVFSHHFHISGTVTPAPQPPATVHGYVYSNGQRYAAADTTTDAFGNWTLDFDLTGVALGSDAQVKVIVDVPNDPASQIMGLSVFGLFLRDLFDEFAGRNGFGVGPAR